MQVIFSFHVFLFSKPVITLLFAMISNFPETYPVSCLFYRQTDMIRPLLSFDPEERFAVGCLSLFAQKKQNT
jgi:hypothetical protein